MQGLKPLKRNRWPLLWHLENRCEAQQPKLADLLTLRLPPVNAYLFKDSLQQAWKYSP